MSVMSTTGKCTTCDIPEYVFSIQNLVTKKYYFYKKSINTNKTLIYVQMRMHFTLLKP